MSTENNIFKKRVSEILLNIDAVEVSAREPFQYASGILSPIYTKCRILLSYPKERKFIIDIMIKQIEDIKDQIDIIASAGNSSTFLASLLTQYLDIPMIFVRPNRKKHGKKKEIEGDFKSGSNVLLVSDIFSTEDDIPNSVETIQKNGGKIIFCLTVFDNNLGIINKFLKNKGIPYATLTDLTTLLETAVENRKIDLKDKRTVEDWIKDPKNWNSIRIGKVTIKNHKKDFKKLEKIKSEKFEDLKKENERKIEETGSVEDLLDLNKKNIAKILLKIKAITINSKEPFRYTSGLLSPIYTDNRLLISHPKEWKQIIDAFVDAIINLVGLDKFDILSGVAMSGIPHATLISEKLGIPLVYVKTEKNRVGYIEGRFRNGMRAIIIEDHITTGKSSLESIRTLRNNGITVDWCIAIFSYNLEKAINSFKKEKIKLITLCDIFTLIDVAEIEQNITIEDRNAVIEWQKNPDTWESMRQK
ncbi:MAG: orotate phosphoribosyltransferase [Candidatus Helarchaeota archaeon]